MDTLIKARKVADYVSANWRITSLPQDLPLPVSTNLAAILVDAIFQAGLNYKTVVFPRVCAVAAAFPRLNSLSDLERAMRTQAFASALAWAHPEKPKRLCELVRFLRAKELDSLNDLRGWFSVASNRLTLLQVRGIGHKTVDYLCRLLGLSAIAVDRHAHRLLRNAGIVARTYLEARRILEFAADLLNVHRWLFDQFVWRTLSRVGEI